MSDNLFNSRFIQAGRTPAWHVKGWLLGDEEIGAEEAHRRTGTYEVNKIPLVARNGDWETNVPYCIIVRDPVKDDPVHRIFGRPVSKDYELIGPMQSAQVWDRAVGNNGTVETPIETYGVLGRGEELFITAQTFTFDVKGDEINAYEYFYSPMYSDKAAVVGLTAVRVVCANTLAAALNGSTQKFYIDHLPGATAKLERTIRDMHVRNRENVKIMREAFEAMSDIKVSGKVEAESLIEQVYESPPTPLPEWDMQFGISYQEHLQKFEEKMAVVGMIREKVYDLYTGAGTGMDRDSVKGNRFGIFNAVSELETFRRGPFDRAAVSLVAGDRASTIRKAFSVLVNTK